VTGRRQQTNRENFKARCRDAGAGRPFERFEEKLHITI
jgi:hypothetical protein